MTNIQLACYALIASACFLAGLLFVQLQGHAIQSAEADLVMAGQNITIMTTRTKSNEEALFVLNSVTNRLLIYTAQVRAAGRGSLSLVGSEDITRWFGMGGERGGGGRGTRPR